MGDPWEGRALDGTITTGALRARVPARFEPVLAAAVDVVERVSPSASLGVYGSVATGQARSPTSDVDLLAIGLAPTTARRIGAELSARYPHLCREVTVGAGSLSELHDRSDAAHGNRVFLRHYAVHLSGVDHAHSWAPFPADVRAARGFNGDIHAHALDWRRLLETRPPGDLGRWVARKTLLALSGLVSIRDDTWTTDRSSAARRWAELEPRWNDDISEMLAWSDGRSTPTTAQVRNALDGIVRYVVACFADEIGLWT